MGIGSATGENRTVEATKKAISSPLLEVSIAGAKQVLLNITGGPDMSLFEAQDASDIVAQAATDDVNIIFGTSINEELGDEVVVTVIATGIDETSIGNGGRAAQRAANAKTAPATPATEPTTKPADDPFGQWDLRQEPSERQQEPSSSELSGDKPSFDIYESQPNQSQPDNSDDQPPFFKRRRQN